MEKAHQKIADYLLLNSRYMQDIGLFHGKMGVVVALYAYALRYNDELMEEFARDLFLQVYDGAHADMPVGLESGLAGIGYATTLLYSQGWVECDLNAVLADIDTKIMERDPRRIADCSLRTGAGGILCYLEFRQQAGGPLLTFDHQYLTELQAATAHKAPQVRDTTLLHWLNKPNFIMDDYIEKPLGIDGGGGRHTIY